MAQKTNESRDQLHGEEAPVFEPKKEQSKTAEQFALLTSVIEQLHTLETGISVTEKLLHEVKARSEEFPSVSETLSSIEEVLGVKLIHETRQAIEKRTEESATGIELLLEKMRKRKEFLETTRERLAAGTKKEEEGQEQEPVTIDADLDTLSEHEKLKSVQWKTAHEDGVYRIKEATVRVPKKDTSGDGKKSRDYQEVHLVLIENKADLKDDVVLTFETQPRAEMISIPEVFEELERMGTTKKRNVVEIDADRRSFYEDLIRANLVRGSIVQGPNGTTRLYLREQVVPWSFLPEDEFVAMGKANQKKYQNGFDAIKDLAGRAVPKEIFTDRQALSAYLKGGTAWDEYKSEHSMRTYTTKSGELASQDKG